MKILNFNLPIHPRVLGSLFLLFSSLSNAQTASSTFDSGAEDWKIARRSYNSFKVTKIVDPVYAFVGNPGGCLQNQDGPYDFYFRAPSKFLGDQSSAMGGRLEFDVASDLEDAPAPPDYSVILVGRGITHYQRRRTALSSRSLLANRWVRFSIGLDEESGWINASTGLPSTSKELATCLASLEILDINGEFAGGSDTGRLDNVQLYSAPESPVAISDPRTNPANGHTYFLLSASTWPAAERKAQSMGGHLVAVNDLQEQNWVVSTFATWTGTNRSLWIGLNDNRIVGTHEWANGDSTSYRNWRPSEPNTFYGINHCVRIVAPGYLDAASWVVDTTITSGVHGVVELVSGPAVSLEIRSAVELSWSTRTTNRYQLQVRRDLASEEWTNVGDEIQGNGSSVTVYAPSTTLGVSFYRVLSSTLP